MASKQAFRVVVTQAPTTAQIDQALALSQAAALYKASRADVPATERKALADRSLVEIGEALRGRVTTETTANAIAALFTVLGIAHRVVAL